MPHPRARGTLCPPLLSLAEPTTKPYRRADCTQHVISGTLPILGAAPTLTSDDLTRSITRLVWPKSDFAGSADLLGDNYICALTTLHLSIPTSAATRRIRLILRGWGGPSRVRTTDAQVRKLMDEMHRHGEVGTAALRAGLSPNTRGSTSGQAGCPRSWGGGPRTWRTREDANYSHEKSHSGKSRRSTETSGRCCGAAGATVTTSICCSRSRGPPPPVASVGPHELGSRYRLRRSSRVAFTKIVSSMLAQKPPVMPARMILSMKTKRSPVVDIPLANQSSTKWACCPTL